MSSTFSDCGDEGVAAARGDGASPKPCIDGCSDGDAPLPPCDDDAPLLRMLCDGDAREALFSALDIKDAAALRAVSPRLREEVAQHPWDGAPLSFDWLNPHDGRYADDFTWLFVRHGLRNWCASFPRARHIKIRWDFKAFDAHGAQMPLLRNLRRVHLALYMYALEPVALDLSVLHAVRELVVAVKHDAPLTFLNFGHLPHITHLELYRCNINGDGLRALTTLRRLVVVSCNSFDSSVLWHLPNIDDLDVTSSPMDSADLAALTKLRVLRVKELYSKAGLTDAHLAPLIHLEQLSLHDAYNFTGVALLEMPHLTRVFLRECFNVTNAAVRALWGAMACKTARCELRLENCLLLTSACVPVEHNELSSDDVSRMMHRLYATFRITSNDMKRRVGIAHELAVMMSAYAGMTRRPLTNAETHTATVEHLRLLAIVPSLTVARHVAVDVMINV